MAELKEDAIRKYFKPFPKWTVVAIGVGVIFTFVGGDAISLAIALFVIGGVGLWLGLQGKPTDAAMDRHIASVLNIAEEKALLKTSLDDAELVGDPLIVKGIRFTNRGGAELLVKRGRDRTIRFSPIDVTVLLMTQHQIVAYQAALDLPTGKYLNESTDEYFYNDVVSISTQSREFKLERGPWGGETETSAETFQLTTSGNTSISTTIGGDELSSALGGGTLPSSEADRAVQVVRKMLREKKSA